MPAVKSLSLIRAALRRRKRRDQHLAPKPGTDGVLAMGLAHVLVAEGLHDETWLMAHTIGWPQLRERLAELSAGARRRAYRTAGGDDRCTGASVRHASSCSHQDRRRHQSQSQRRPERPRHLRLPALTGQYGTRGGGLAYSTSGYLQWVQPTPPAKESPPPGRIVNMNRLGAALLGEATNPPIQSLYVFGANPATSTPNAGQIVQGLQRDDLFTVVHELFLTDTADYADLVLPATSQLEHVDLHKAYGQTMLTYNHPAIPPRGECKSNWEVMGLLATAMGFDDPWLHQSADEVIDEVLTATAKDNPFLRGITLERLQRREPCRWRSTSTPFADGVFPTPSGKVELYSQKMADAGLDPLPGRFREITDDTRYAGSPQRGVASFRQQQFGEPAGVAQERRRSLRRDSSAGRGNARHSSRR